MALVIPPPPPDNIQDTKVWRDWILKLYHSVQNVSGITFATLDFTGSNLTAIQTRNHDDLQNIKGDGTYHLSQTEMNTMKSEDTLVWLSM